MALFSSEVHGGVLQSWRPAHMGTVASAIPVSLFCCSLWSFHNPALPLKHHPCQSPHFLLRSLHLGTCFWRDFQSHGISQGFITSWQERLGNRHKGLRSLGSWITMVIQVIQNFFGFPAVFLQAGTAGWLADLPRTQVITVTIKRSGI